MPEWLYEAGIGEARAALIDNGRILEARIELDNAALRTGAILEARLLERPARLTRIALDGGEAMLARAPAGLTEGARLLVEITREAIPERGRPKLAKAVPSYASEPRSGPDLRTRIAASGAPLRELLPHQPDDLEAAGWSETLGEAVDGEIAFAGGNLRMAITPAMTLFDVDGDGPLAALAVNAATAVTQAMVRHDITGSIGVDFPTLKGKAERQAVAAAIDAALPPPFERTALNGFGFLQIVRPRTRASLPELLAAYPGGAQARALLRRLEREPPGSPVTHTVPSALWRALQAHPIWTETLARRTGRTHQFETRA